MAKEKVPISEINALLSDGKTKKEIAKLYGVSLETIYRTRYRHGFIETKGNQRAGYEAVLKKYGKEHFDKMREKSRLSQKTRKDRKIKISYLEYQKLLCESERYRKEAEAGRLLLKDLRHIPPFHEYIDALAFTDASGAWDRFVNASEAQIIKILTTYRQAVEQKEV